MLALHPTHASRLAMRSLQQQLAAFQLKSSKAPTTYFLSVPPRLKDCQGASTITPASMVSGNRMRVT